MTEAEWLASDSPKLMFQHLHGRVSERKLLLFGVACCRRLWDHTWHERSRRAIELVERYADGEATAAEVGRIAEEAEQAPEDDYDGTFSGTLAGFLTGGDPFEAAVEAEFVTTGWVGEFAGSTGGSEDAAEDDETTAHVGLLHDIFDDAFRPVAFEPAWLASHDAVGKLARLIYDERLFEHMPLLGDALEEAGCVDEDILSHCRTAAEHARGCWVIDAILGRS